MTTKKLGFLFEKHNKPCYISLKYDNPQKQKN